MIRYATARTGYDELVAMASAGKGAPWRTIIPFAEIPARDAAYWDRYRGVLNVDPREAYARLRIPVLAILGERDERILVERHASAFRRLASSGVDLTLWIEPGASHGLLVDEATVPRYSSDFYQRLADWVRGRVASSRTR
jgi:pimeloyl-ACP methyl ester carboxylesterase